MVDNSTPRIKLRGHTASVLCCVSSVSSPHLVTTSSEDKSVCVFDLRTKTCLHRLQCFGSEHVVSVSLKPGKEEILYAAAGAQVYCLDLRLGPSASPLHTYNFNSEEINQVAVNHKGTFLAAADDSGEIKVINLQNHKLFKTLQGVHSNICSSAVFHPRRPWEVVSGGLDSKIVKWDFSRGRPLHVVDLASTANISNEGVGQICNPPFVHSLSVTEGDIPGEAGKLMAAGRGDGGVDVFDLSFENSNAKTASKTSGPRQKASFGNYSHGSMSTESNSEPDTQLTGRKRHLNLQNGAHASTVNHVTFARFGEQGRFLVSGGNDGFIKLWDWALEESPPSTNALSVSCKQRSPLLLNIDHKRKVNWLSTTSTASENLVVADTSKIVSIYSVL
ncbi:unnamed protein product [Sphagnum compactum]